MSWREAHPGLNELFFSISLVLGAYVLARLVSFGVGAAISRSTDGGIDRRLLEALKRPVTYSLFLMGVWAGVSRHPVTPGVDAFLRRGLFAIGILLLTVALARSYAILLEWYALRPRPDGTARELAREFTPLFDKVGKVFLALVAATMLLQHFGINVASLVVSLGVGSLALGLAAQDTLSNMFAGFTLLVDRPFRVGDRIQLSSGELGDVQAIGMRATLIKTLDETILVVPNSVLVKERLVNQSRPTRHLTTRVEVGVAYGSDLRKAREVLRRAAVSSPYVDADREPVVLVTRLAEYTVNFLVVFWARDCAEQGLARSDVTVAAHEGLAAAGIEIPLPIRRVITEGTGAPAPGEE